MLLGIIGDLVWQRLVVVVDPPALVHADASVELGGKQGSIHQIGAAAQGAPSCNGWTFWHVEQGGDLVCLDDLRQRYIATLG